MPNQMLLNISVREFCRGNLFAQYFCFPAGCLQQPYNLDIFSISHCFMLARDNWRHACPENIVVFFTRHIMLICNHKTGRVLDPAGANQAVITNFRMDIGIRVL